MRGKSLVAVRDPAEVNAGRTQVALAQRKEAEAASEVGLLVIPGLGDERRLVELSLKIPICCQAAAPLAIRFGVFWAAFGDLVKVGEGLVIPLQFQRAKCAIEVTVDHISIATNGFTEVGDGLVILLENPVRVPAVKSPSSEVGLEPNRLGVVVQPRLRAGL